MRRLRKAKIVATLGPASHSFSMIEKLFQEGADIFRLNFSHATPEDHQKAYDHIRKVEEKYNYPLAILADLQGPKIRIGKFEAASVQLVAGQDFQLDLDPTPGNKNRVHLPHSHLLKVLIPQTDVLLDDGRIRLKVTQIHGDKIITTVINGGILSNHKGLNVPSIPLPVSALTEKDKKDLAFALDLGVDWIALSFVQRAQDIEEAQLLIKGRARLLTKIEKPMALHCLDDIITLSDAIMVARGDLGVEMSLEKIPCLQKQIIKACRLKGKPVIVATQMLESMIKAPIPTRAEASDVATAIYDGVDAVMLSAESASGSYPVEAVSMMNRIITTVENDEDYRKTMETTRPSPEQNVDEALTAAGRVIANIIPIKAIVTFTESGRTVFKEARERPLAPIIGLTPNLKTARMINLLWGTHPVLSPVINTFDNMVETGCNMVKNQGIACSGDFVAVLAGVPFGGKGGTNILHVVEIK